MIWWVVGLIFSLAVLDKIVPMKTHGGLWASGFVAIALGFVALLAIGANLPRRPPDVSMSKPLAAKPAPKTPTAIWQAKVHTLACGTPKNIQTLLYLDAIGRGQGLRNPASDASQTDCMHMLRGAKLGIYDWKFDEGIASVHVPKVGVRYMIAADIEPAK